MPKVKKDVVEQVKEMFSQSSVGVKSTEQPKRSLCLLSWDKRIMCGMLHITSDTGSAVYYVRRIDTLTPTFYFQKLQPTEDGLNLNLPYTTHLYKRGSSLQGSVWEGVCHCDGYRNRKECRHVDAAITMIEEYTL